MRKRRAFATKWVADGQDRIKKQPDIIRQMLANCRFSKNFSGSDNNQIKIKGIEHYKISPTEKEFDILDNGTTEAATGGVL